MRKRLLTIAILALFAMTLAVQGATVTAYPIEIRDATGFKVVLKSEPMRIVSIVPSITEMVFAVGLGEKVVGVTSWCTYPDAARNVDKVGDVNINIEAVLAKKPDLVLADLSMSGTTVAKLRELSLTVLAVDAASIGQMLDALVMIGKAGGSESKARELALHLEDRVRRIEAAVGTAKTKPSVFVEIWNEPLMTAGKGTYIDEIVSLAGGRNIAGDVQGWPIFSHETVIAEDPYLILLTNFNKNEAMGRKAWQSLSALKTGRIVEVDPDLFVRSGPRLVDGLEMLAKLLHPELF